MAERLISKSHQINRVIAAYALKAIWPFELKEHTPGNLARFEEVIREGHGAVGLVPHFSKADFLTILGSLALSSKEFTKRPILIPISAHQRPIYLRWLCAFGNINLATIITGDTRRMEKQLRAKGRRIPWQGLDPSAAMNQYLNRAQEVLMEGGIVMLAPSGGRRESLRPFKGGPIAHLETWAMEMGVNNLAFFPIGLKIPGATDYSDLSGLNLRSKYIITLGTITKREKIKGDIDVWSYQNMLQLAPPAYRPQRLQS